MSLTICSQCPPALAANYPKVIHRISMQKAGASHFWKAPAIFSRTVPYCAGV